MSEKHRVVISKKGIIFTAILWFIGFQILFLTNPSIFSRSRIRPDITWEFDDELLGGNTVVIFTLQCEIWTNSPIPLLSLPGGAYLQPRGECFIENNTFLIGNDLRPLVIGLVPSYSIPGSHIYSLQIGFDLNRGSVTEIPEGIYHFWVQFYMGPDTPKYYKTYMNVTGSGVLITSEDTPPLWGEFFSSTFVSIGIIIGFPLVMQYIIDSVKNRKKEDNSTNLINSL